MCEHASMAVSRLQPVCALQCCHWHCHCTGELHHASPAESARMHTHLHFLELPAQFIDLSGLPGVLLLPKLQLAHQLTLPMHKHKWTDPSPSTHHHCYTAQACTAPYSLYCITLTHYLPSLPPSLTSASCVPTLAEDCANRYSKYNFPHASSQRQGEVPRVPRGPHPLWHALWAGRLERHRPAQPRWPVH